jgi:hypothetical protein
LGWNEDSKSGIKRCDRFLQMPCPAYALTETQKSGAEIGVGHRPIERLALARLLLQRRARLACVIAHCGGTRSRVCSSSAE